MITQKQNSSGFTIIELLVATTVFTVMLLISSVAIVGLSRQFYKGLTKSKTQEVARAISDEIAKNIQYSKVAPFPLTGGPAGTSHWCIANSRYSMRLGRQLGDGTGTTTQPVLVRSDGCVTPGATFTRGANDSELMGEGMRLSAFEITSDAQQKVYQIRVKVVFGGDDQLTNPGTPAAECSNQFGQQFCAVSEFVITVVRNL